ncbi:uncharacterized protein PADG_12122 [Paracoccidioides brasiliensis Pb18]|uniref:Phosphoglycerate mutase n=1 Tax=Paracoccidioides brasiliensis (strain Pb18) TaxID=502780 RepID=A0A0A0HUW9_PARBD|nr:uncharacterized protein PADG_12122 [Paracoccidioides brasiliensis Pb18]KGM91806.1 hypothetical protein PADG_12122 [Paracoccidioides brasiliensis Pb18]
MGGYDPLALPHFEYSTVPGYFLQDDPDTDPADFDYATSAFGLKTQPYDTDASFDPHRNKTQWERFAYKLHSLNVHADPDTEFKLLYLGRHGEGFHNVAERLYGTEAWDLLRETLGIHTCDRRSPTSYILSTYPTYTLEPHFAPTDPLWTPDLRESNAARVVRLRNLLDDVVRGVWGQGVEFVSLTAHSGAITSLLEVVGHREFPVGIGGVLPAFVRVVRKGGAGAKGGEGEESRRAPECWEGILRN